MFENYTDEALYILYFDNNIDALEELVKRYSDMLVLFVNKYINNMEDAEDIMMNTFMAIMLHKIKFKNHSSFKTYIFSIAKHKAIDYLRKNKLKCCFMFNIDEYNLEEQLISENLNKNIIKNLKKLPKEYEEVLYLSYFEKMKVHEISILLNKDKKQIYNLLCRGKAKLKKI